MPRTALTTRARVTPPPPKPEPVPAGALLRGLILVLIIPALVFSGVFAYGKYEHFSAAAPAPGQPGALVWSNGDVIFSNKNQIAAWERLHGGSFQGFKKNHPAAVELVSTPKVAKAQTKIAAGTKTAVKRSAKTPVKTPTHAEAAAPTPGVSGGSSTARTSVYALSGVALLLLLLACAPVALLWRLPVVRGLRIPELRLLFGGAGAAIAAGLAVSLLLS